MTILLIGVFLALVLLVWAWVTGIDFMNKNHPDYKGEDWLTWDEEDKKTILMPARFTSWKGHEFLIDSLTKVKNDFFCVMVGSDHGHKKYRKKIEQKIVRDNLAGKVRIVDAFRDMPAAYRLCHFVLAPSVRPEAFGRVAIEAQASSKIIASRCSPRAPTVSARRSPWRKPSTNTTPSGLTLWAWSLMTSSSPVLARSS
jgi:glycosyltransferase involved in cell wall biosynthesis